MVNFMVGVSGTLVVVILGISDIVHVTASRVGAICSIKLWHS
jgi:hypothetical protein